jgi:cytochrome c
MTPARSSGQTGWVWTPEKLQWYLSQPARKANPDTRMKYDGLDDAEQPNDLIGFPGTVP